MAHILLIDLGTKFYLEVKVKTKTKEISAGLFILLTSLLAACGKVQNKATPVAEEKTILEGTWLSENSSSNYLPTYVFEGNRFQLNRNVHELRDQVLAERYEGTFQIEGSKVNLTFEKGSCNHFKKRASLTYVIMDVRNDVLDLSDGKSVPFQSPAKEKQVSLGCVYGKNTFVPNALADL